MPNENVMNTRPYNDGESIESMLKTRFEHSVFPVMEIFKSLKDSVLNKDPNIRT